MTPPPVDHRIILAHPDRDSFCAAAARRWAARVRGHHQSGSLRDLYSEGFDPVLKDSERPGKAQYDPSSQLLSESASLEAADVLVFVYPIWFGAPPAMMKGFIDRVLGNATTFARDGSQEKPLSRTRLVQISTSAGASSWLAEQGVESALHTMFDRYLTEVLGCPKSYRLHLDGILDGMSPARGDMELARVDALADQVCADANAARWERARASES